MKKRNILLTTITLISLAYSGLNADQLTQKEKAINLLEKAFSTKQDRSGLAYINEKKYIQHNLYAQDGINGLNGYLDYLKGKELENKVLIAFEDDNHVITLSLSSQEKQSSKVIDIFRFEKGLIVEHWDNSGDLDKNEKLEIVKITDLDKTKENKQLIKEIIDKKVLDGKYLKNHKILAQGNFVLALNELERNNQKISLYELFDIKDSKIINTWKIEEVIPDISQWQNSNGKF
jgi:predicted SnoaL-like aldol condensation-catalyzing enzyme